ncbi:hypothetical protein EAO79_00455 [Plantibacter sp. PA-3-X8]|uniref:hypothetical protein n=1 Tax=Plantibacter sp. PA-3-X8 TaxID=2480625 RepID=UPI000F5DD3B1|nr:hypothetical protein [Plantibacter sp. PA-3-X8]AZH81536.1 hypothetical protein EAO79_00455 [Plantibacter sp. PA-3-X8]
MGRSEGGLVVAQAWTAAVQSATRELHRGLDSIDGVDVEELWMPLDEDKGTALQRIIRADGLRVVAYAGDDRGDLPAFRVALASGGYALVVEGPDAAEEVARMPGVHFSGPGEFQQWLQQLDDALS